MQALGSRRGVKATPRTLDDTRRVHVPSHTSTQRLQTRTLAGGLALELKWLTMTKSGWPFTVSCTASGLRLLWKAMLEGASRPGLYLS